MELIAEKRKELRKKVKSLRENRQIPAVIFAKDMDSVSITIDQNKFVKVFSEAGETGLVDLSIDGKKEKVLIKDVQFDPVKSTPIHVGFHKVNLKEKIEADIPVEVIGEEENPLVKSGEGLVLVVLNEIPVEALPSDLPNHFEVDVSGLAELDAAITVADLKYNKEKVEILDLEPDEIVVKIDRAQMAEEPEEAVVTEEEALAQVQATEELTEEEKAARAAKETEKEEK